MNKIANEINNYFYFLMFWLTLEFIVFSIKSPFSFLKVGTSRIGITEELFRTGSIFLWNFTFAIFLRKQSHLTKDDEKKIASAKLLY